MLAQGLRQNRGRYGPCRAVTLHAWGGFARSMGLVCTVTRCTDACTPEGQHSFFVARSPPALNP